jgi:hypothetical protein
MVLVSESSSLANSPSFTKIIALVGGSGLLLVVVGLLGLRCKPKSLFPNNSLLIAQKVIEVLFPLDASG